MFDDTCINLVFICSFINIHFYITLLLCPSFHPPPPPLILFLMSTSPSFIHHPLHHLFSPTTLKHDLSYVDKTYYPSTNNNNSNSTHPISHHNNNTSNSNDDDSKITITNEKTQLSITRMHDLVFNRALGMISTVSRLDL